MAFKKIRIPTDRKFIDNNLFMCQATSDDVRPLILKFHYSKRMPAKIQKCFVIRKRGGFSGFDGEIIAATIVSVSSAAWAESVLEMSRIVRNPICKVPLTKLISFACTEMVKLKHTLMISYADKLQDHHGGLYQAAGWFYHGERTPIVDGLIVNGKYIPKRTCNVIFGSSSIPKLAKRFPYYTFEERLDKGKHLYWRPLTRAGNGKAERMGMIKTAYPKPKELCGPSNGRTESTPSELGANPRGRST